MFIFCIAFSYFTSNTSFPQPLSAELERKYLELYAEGDMDARNTLIEHNLRLVAHIVKKYTNYSKESEDLISIGTVGLIKGISSFKLDKGTRLSTYSARCIENEILMNIRSTKKQRGEISLESPIGTDNEGNEINLLNILCDDKDTVLDQVSLKFETKRLYKKMESTLQSREGKVIELRYGLNNQKELTQREIAKIMGISRSYVSRIEKKALIKLKETFNKE